MITNISDSSYVVSFSDKPKDNDVCVIVWNTHVPGVIKDFYIRVHNVTTNREPKLPEGHKYSLQNGQSIAGIWKIKK